MRILITGDDARALEVEPRGARGAAVAESWAAAARRCPASRSGGGERS